MKRALIGALLALGAAAFAPSCASDPTEFGEQARARARELSGFADAENTRASVAGLVAARRLEQPVVSPYSIEEPYTQVESARFVTEGFRALGYEPIVERASLNGIDSQNIYVDIPGASPELVLVTGHHDAWFQSGADDNASAIAVMLEVARILKDARLKRTIRLLAFDNEEIGLVGSVRYVAAHSTDRVRVVLNMDCVGFASREPGSQGAPPGLALRDVGDFLAVIANGPAHADASKVLKLSTELPKPVDVLALLAPGDGNSPAGSDFSRSDHATFWGKGVPALFLTDTADFRNHNYHTENDLPETLDYDFLHRVTMLVAAAAVAFAEDE